MSQPIWGREDLATACDAFRLVAAAQPRNACIAVPALA